jgi:glutathione peroxidase-family protein
MSATAQGAYDIPFRDAEGKTRTLREYSGAVLLLVNTASY